jgi:4-carboxymuconolactone decarboxylase
MARLPDPTEGLCEEDRVAFDHIAGERAAAEGRATLGDVYVQMFNNPAVARVVGALGEELRFHGDLPDDVREAVILRFAARHRLAYVWSHHRRVADRAGVDSDQADALAGRAGAEQLPERFRAAVQAVDAVVDGRSIPEDVQRPLVASWGERGVVELVALCGLYGLIGMMVVSFDVTPETGLPPAPF